MGKRYWDLKLVFSELWIDIYSWENRLCFINYEWMKQLKIDIEEYLAKSN